MGVGIWSSPQCEPHDHTKIYCLVGDYLLRYLYYYFNFRREPTLALSEYPVKNWSFWQKLSQVYHNLDIIKKQRSLNGLSFPSPARNSGSKSRIVPTSEDSRIKTRNSKPARRFQNRNQDQDYYMRHT